MHLNHFEAIQIVQTLSYQLDDNDYQACDVSVHPPFTDLRSVQTVLESDRIPVLLGAQHCHFEEKGAFTGEVSPGMLEKLNVKLVIVGHSERREVFGEDNEMVNSKIKSVFKHSMTPILCVGETIEEREEGEAQSKVQNQIQAGLKGIGKERISSMVIAYEPIWAIGTGLTPSLDEIEEVHSFIKNINEKYNKFKILYGGSVNAENSADINNLQNVDGCLVGGASLKVNEFNKIIS